MQRQTILNVVLVILAIVWLSTGGLTWLMSGAFGVSTGEAGLGVGAGVVDYKGIDFGIATIEYQDQEYGPYVEKTAFLSAEVRKVQELVYDYNYVKQMCEVSNDSVYCADVPSMRENLKAEMERVNAIIVPEGYTPFVFED